MKNLNKFTKAELINKYTKLENLNHQNSNQTQTQSKYHSILKIIDKIQLFKSLIIKITLIGLIIKWIKKYSFVRKFWHIFSLIGSSLLGFSLIDIYSWDIISWIKDSSIYKWYIELINYSKTDKIDTIENSSKFPKGMIERTSIETNGIQTESEINNRINKWFNKEEITNKEPEVLSNEEINKIDSNNHNYKYYFIVGSIVIISGIVYYYWNDIRPAAGDAGNTIVDKIRSFRSWFNSDSSNINNNNTGDNQVNIPTNVNPDIQLIDNNQSTVSSSNIQDEANQYFKDNNQPVVSSSNIKTVLTSPSLENLNEQAETSWSEGSSSPGSDKTITQASISSSLNIESNISSSSSSSSINTISTASNFIKQNWRKRFTEETNDKINFIESSLNSEIDLDEGLKLVDYYAFLINEYNKEIDLYNSFKSDTNQNIQDLNIMRQSIYYFREWISEYHNKILPTSNVTIKIGSIQDSPKIISKNISN